MCSGTRFSRECGGRSEKPGQVVTSRSVRDGMTMLGSKLLLLRAVRLTLKAELSHLEYQVSGIDNTVVCTGTMQFIILLRSLASRPQHYLGTKILGLQAKHDNVMILHKYSSSESALNARQAKFNTHGLTENI